MLVMDIKQIETETKGHAYVGEDANKPLAAMMYTVVNPELIIINHTEVDASLKGQGVGKQLLSTIVEDARGKGRKIIPLCPFARSVFMKDKSIHDVMR